MEESSFPNLALQVLASPGRPDIKEWAYLPSLAIKSLTIFGKASCGTQGTASLV